MEINTSKKYIIIAVLVTLFWLFLGISELLLAQSTLSRISVSERSDEKGFVIRFHLSEPADSFKVAHVKQTKVQFKLYGSEIYKDDSLILPESSIIERLKSFHSDEYIIFDFLLNEEYAFEVAAYPDVNDKDMLIALTNTEMSFSEEYLSKSFFTDGYKVTHFDNTLTKEIEKLATEETESTPPEKIIEDSSYVINENNDTAIRRVTPGDPMESYLRNMGVSNQNSRQNHHIRYSGHSGSVVYNITKNDHPWANHSFFLRNSERELHPNVVLFSPVIHTSYNSDYPIGGNDGAMWQGRGWNQSLSAGIGYKNDFLEIVLRPVYVRSENQDFELSPTPPYDGFSEFAMALTNSDIPQRFGLDSIQRLDLGESFLKLKYNKWAAGVSNERIRTGPSVSNPLIFGYNAPGFIHSFLGTNEPVDFLNGRIHTRLFWGVLKGSDYLFEDEDVDNQPEDRFLSGFSINYNPDFLQNLHIGLNRVAVSYYPESGIGFRDLTTAFQRSQERSEDIDINDARLTKTTFYIRWTFPETGFETYAEWGRYDNKRRIRDIFLEPELNRAYVLGFKKRFNLGPTRSIVLGGEITNLENSSVTTQSRDFNIWYTHPVIKHGFTHRGQVLGSPIGPGSSTQQMGLSYYDRFGMIGFTLGRIAYHNDRFFENMEFFKENRDRPWIPIYFFQEIEMYGAIEALLFIPGGIELQANARYGVIENRNNQYNVDTSGGIVRRFLNDQPNWNLSFTLRYQFSNWNR